MKKLNLGKEIYRSIMKLFPLNRSLTGNGNRKSLKILGKIAGKMKILEFKSGKKVYDWTIPPEWNVKDAYIKCDGKKIVDLKKNNLHLVSYSEPINEEISFKELNKNLYSIKNKPTSIPYITSYYKKRWGFCLKHNERIKLNKFKSYKVYIDSSFDKKGSLSIGEIIIKGKSKKEIILSTNICHPSLVNNELCAPVILAYLAKHYSKLNNFFTLRILFLPETIGAITYINKNLKTLKKNFRAGFHITCFGDRGNFSMVSTKYGNSYSDKVANKVLKTKKKFKVYKFQKCGSDERQYNFPGVNLPVVTLTRTKFGNYKEYHNSMDNLKITNPKILLESFNFLVKLVNLINYENKIYFKNKIQNKLVIKKLINSKYNTIKVFSKTKCEPFLSKRNLYRNVSKNFLTNDEFIMFNLLYYGDGNTIANIANILKSKSNKVYKIAVLLEKNKLVKLSK